MSVDWALVYPSLLLEGSSSTNMNGFCVTSLEVRGVNVFQKLTTRLCLGLRVCISVYWALVFPSLLLEGSSSTNMNGFCVTSLDQVVSEKTLMKNVHMCCIRVIEGKIKNLKKEGKMRISTLLFIYIIHFAYLKVYTKFHNSKSCCC